MKKQKSIGIDISLLYRNTGMGSVIRALLPSILAHKDYSFVLFSTNKASLDYVKKAKHIKKVYIPLDRFEKQNPLYEQFILPFLLFVVQVDVCFFPYNTIPLFHIGRYKRIVLIHDLIYMTKRKYPSLKQLLAQKYRKWIVKAVVSRADHIVTISQESRKALVQYFPYMQVPISIIPNPVGPLFLTQKAHKGVLSQYALEEKKYFMAFLAHDPRKNALGVIKAYETFLKEFPEYKLVFVGVTDFIHTNAYIYATKHNLLSHIIFTGFVSQPSLIDLYSFAQALVYPSLEEGFGMPILEAYTRGIQVITSKSGATEEIAQGEAILIDPEDVNSIYAGMEKALVKEISDRSNLLLQYDQKVITDNYISLFAAV